MLVNPKPIEEFRNNIVDKVFAKLRQETSASLKFIKKSDYARAKMCESRIEAYHLALGIILDESSIIIKE